MNFRKVFSIIAGGLLTVGAMTVPASAITLTFEQVPSNNGNPDVSSQLVVEVTDDGTQALFDISVTAGAVSTLNLTEIYFDDDNGVFQTPISVISQSAGVNFNTIGSANPGDLPGGNQASVDFDVTPGLLLDSQNGNGNGVDVGESIVLGLLYSVGSDFDDVVTALNDGLLRIGFHIRSIDGGESDSFVNVPPVTEVPIPGAIWLMGAGIAGLGFARRRKAAA